MFKLCQYFSKIKYLQCDGNSQILFQIEYKVYYRKFKPKMQQIVIDSILDPNEKIQRFKKKLITALNSINLRMRQKQFHHTRYAVDWYQKEEQAQKQIRKNSYVSTKSGNTTKFNKLTFKSVKQRNSFPRHHKNNKNFYQKSQDEYFYKKKDNQKEQNANKGRVILNICKLENSDKFSKLSSKDESSFTLNVSLSRAKVAYQQMREKNPKQPNLLVVNRLRKSLKINKKILNEKYQKLQKSLNMRENSVTIGRSMDYLKKKTDYSMQKMQNTDPQLCRWEEEQQKQNCLYSPAF